MRWFQTDVTDRLTYFVRFTHSLLTRAFRAHVKRMFPNCFRVSRIPVIGNRSSTAKNARYGVYNSETFYPCSSFANKVTRTLHSDPVLRQRRCPAVSRSGFTCSRYICRFPSLIRTNAKKYDLECVVCTVNPRISAQSVILFLRSLTQRVQLPRISPA